MAEAVLEVVLENLSSLIKKELSLFLGVHEDLKSLASMLTTIKATLEDAEEKQFTDRAIKVWLQKLKDAAYVLDDILDECSTEALKYEEGSKGVGPSNKVHSYFFSSLNPKHVAFRYKIAKKMKKIRERLDEIAAERSKFHLAEIVREKRSGRVIDWRETTSNIDQPQIYGREEDRDKIIDFFIHEASELEDLSVYPLIGIGGLGKTALAQLIFNHKRVIDHFELTIWVCVSEDFTLKRMIKAIIETGFGHACGDFDLEPLQRKLLELLEGKRFLLVLDDVWDEEQENWMRLRSVLARGGKGASVLVTTRLQKVAAIMGTVPPHDLSMLSDSDCWELFKQRAFGPNEEERVDLVVTGKEIIKKCGGVPLAAIALGSLLRFKREAKEWIYVKESKLWSLLGENSVMAVLRLSYLNLPVKLRQCFAFCALFLKDERISKSFLIELWVANGFISSNEMLEAEDIGNEVWSELYWRSLFQDIETDEFGKITSFNMHDLVHDLAQSITEKECGIIDYNGIPSISERMRHLSIHNPNSFEKPNSVQIHSVESLKTCIGLSELSVNITSPHPLKCYYLRVLKFREINKLPSSIGHLKYLRYLDLSWSRFKTLSEFISKLQNLQILKLDHCWELQKLPNSLIRLKALQQLSLIGCSNLSSLPPQIGKLTSLRILTRYFIGRKRGFLLAELGQLNLKGELFIKNLERVKSVMEAKEANMSSKHLDHLRLSWGRNNESQLQENVEQILEVLQPHTQQLQTLGLGGYPGAYFPQWMSSPSLKDLNHIKLLDCKSCLHLPQFAKLTSLKSLIIYNMGHVTYLDEESSDGGVVGGFIALELLCLDKLPNLISLSRDGRKNSFLHLLRLQITECPKLLGLPCLPSLNYLYVRGKCSQDLLSSIHKLDKLESLRFFENEEVTCFPDGMLQNLTSLKELHIDSLSNLQELRTGNIQLNAIQKLHIVKCESFMSLTDEVLQGLHSLKELYISKCQKFNLSAGFQYLTYLEKLVIGECPEVEGFHEASQHMIALRSLKLCNLQNLSSLPDWLGNLSLLHELIISECPKLRCLPMNIQSLTGLKRLGIYRCSELGKRCQKDTGEDWPKISHVQHLEIENQRFFYSNGAGGEYYLTSSEDITLERPQSCQIM